MDANLLLSVFPTDATQTNHGYMVMIRQRLQRVESIDMRMIEPEVPFLR